MESIRMVLMNLFAGREWRCRHREQTYGSGVEERGKREGDRWREQHGNVHTTTCQIASGDLLYDSGNSNQSSVTT